jgi:DNA ligase-1
MKYLELVNVYEALAGTAKRLEKTKHLSEFLKRTDKGEIQQVMLLLQGLVYPPWDERKLGVADRLVIKAINIASGIDSDKIEHEWKKTGDLGLVAENLMGKKKQVTLFSRELSVKDVFLNLRKLSEAEGQGSVDTKTKLIAELLSSSSPLEARYIIRTVLNDLRIGLGDGTIRDAIVWAFFGLEIGFELDKKGNLVTENRELYNQCVELVQSAYDMTNDFSKIAANGKEGLENIGIEIFEPIKVMLFPKAKGIQDAFETVGRPAAFEYKYDGFRMQIHKQEDKIIIFTRNLENVTAQFPEVVQFVRRNVAGHNFIIDGEAVGFDPKTGKYLPFQSISQRIKRKYDIDRMSKEFPVELNIFDVIMHDGKNLIKTPFQQRRWVLEKIVNPIEKKIILSKQIITDKDEEADKFYQEALKQGFEGIMGKSLDGIYKPGKRVGYGIKIKPTMESLDLVIVQAEWGEGKRSNWLTSYTVACQDDEGELIEIGKVGSGLKELDEEGLSFGQVTEMLKPLKTKEEGKTIFVRPKIIIEVVYEEIQKSTTYTSGFALRFPRILRLRDDKGLDEISTISQVQELYDMQKGKGNA